MPVYPRRNPKLLVGLRINAILVAAGTMAILVTGKAMDPLGSPFFLPDLALSIWLIGAAASPARWAWPGLVSGFGLATGVLGVATMTQVIGSHVGVGLLAGMIASAAGLLLALLYTPRPLALR